METRRTWVGLLAVGLFGVAVGGACASDGDEDDGVGAQGGTAGASTDGGGGAGAGGAMGGAGGIANGGTGGTAQGGAGGAGGGASTQGTCSAPHPLSVSSAVTGDTTGYADNIRAPVWCMPEGGSEDVYELVAPASGAITVTVTSSIDLGIYFRTSCDDYATSVWCVDDVGGGTPEWATFVVAAGETYYLFVDAYTSGEEGAYNLTVSQVSGEASCDDESDDNGDDLFIDCEDPSCAADDTCIATIGAACGAAPALTPGTPQAGDTDAGSEAFAGLNLSCTGLYGGKALPYLYTPSQPELVAFQLDALTDQGILVRTDCTDQTSQVECVDREVSNDEYAYVPMQSGQSYTVFVSAYEAGDEGGFTLHSTAFPLGESEPNDTYMTADDASGDEVGHISGQRDEDWFKVVVGAGQTLTVATVDVLAGDCAGGRSDTHLQIYDTDGTTLLAQNDDVGGANLCSTSTTGALAGGEYFVRVTTSADCPSTDCRAAYRLSISTL